MKYIIKLLLVFMSLFSVVYIACLFLFGILTFSQSNTGPPLVIVYGSDRLESSNSIKEINCFRGAYTTYKIDSDYGLGNIDLSFAFYEIVGVKSGDTENKYYPILKIERFYSVYLLGGILILSIVILHHNILFFIKTRTSSSPQNKKP